MAIVRNILLLAGLLFPLVFLSADDTVHVARAPEESAGQDSLAAAVRTAMAGMTTPELEARRARRRHMQQHGYASVLSQTLRSDGLWALVMYARTSLKLEYSLPRNTLYVYVPVRQPAARDSTGEHFAVFRSGPMAVPLREDRSFPEDPWKP